VAGARYALNRVKGPTRAGKEPGARLVGKQRVRREEVQRQHDEDERDHPEYEVRASVRSHGSVIGH
jgi:hypothetical protein